tara:strand:+ start:912 stop:1559 length:648 start_codon:yes stop_codon:yes gene_type:complete
MENYIYLNNNSLSKEICEEIIIMYESDLKNKYEGTTGGGTDKTVKHTQDLVIPNDDVWSNIHKFLNRELHENVTKYIRELNNTSMVSSTGEKYVVFSMLKTRVYGYQIQRYVRGMGQYIYHDDSLIEYDKKQDRIITFLWYLNTVEEGGETELWGTRRIKPEQGKLLLFPACWTFPHCGRMPISDNKYIITGWVYRIMNDGPESVPSPIIEGKTQ